MPKDLKMSDAEETFTVEVQYDTQGIFPKLVASRKVIIVR